MREARVSVAEPDDITDKHSANNRINDSEYKPDYYQNTHPLTTLLIAFLRHLTTP